MSKLVIVESPAKAHTVGKILGSGYKVVASIGHIRDLPEDKEGIKRVPQPGGGIRFVPDYVVPEKKEPVVQNLAREAKKADEIVLASDPDREGEAIAWHLKEEISKRLGGAAKPFSRVEYHEITPRAVRAAFENPHGIDMPRVDSQQARRCIDRYIGWRVSPRLARAVRGATAAGRVQSVALRLVCDREKEVRAFRPEAYWEFSAKLAKKEPGAAAFPVRLRKLDGAKAEVKDEETARRVEAFLAGASYAVSEAETKPVKKHPGAPFTTSSLQQAASNALHFSPERTMGLAQRLYESGLVTYMRTDSTTVAPEARQAAADWIAANHGPEFADPHNYATRRKGGANAPGPGGAHECIRPTDPAAVPDAVRASLSGTDADAQARLYRLVWERFVSSQMAPAVFDTTSVRVSASAAESAAPGAPASAELTATSSRVSFPGFLALRGAAAAAAAENEGADDADDAAASLPPLAAGEALDLAGVVPERRETKPPARYTEAALVRALEQNGVGRPSTYASTIKTLKDRKYVSVEKRVLSPTPVGETACDYLVARCPEMMNAGYTAAMEEKLDDVQDPATKTDWQDVLGDFYRKLVDTWLPGFVDWADTAAAADLLELFRGVREWRPATKTGARTFDDRTFVQDLARDVMGVQRPKARDRAAEPGFSFERPAELPPGKITGPQFEALGRTLLRYEDQVPGVRDALRAAGLGKLLEESAAQAPDPATERLVALLEKHGPAPERADFFRSLADQLRAGRALSQKQAFWVGRIFLDSRDRIPADEFAAACEAAGLDAASAETVDPEKARRVIGALSRVTKWGDPAPARKGRKAFDDKEFFASVSAQFGARGVLSAAQMRVLDRMLLRYADQIPEAAAVAADYGIEAKPRRRAKARAKS